MRQTWLVFVGLFAFAAAFAVPAAAAQATSVRSASVIVAEAPEHADGGEYEVLIPIVGEVGFYFAVVGGLLATLVFRYKNDQQRLETLRTLVDKGHEVPSALFTRPGGKPASDLKKAMILIALGLGLSGALSMAHLASSAGFGLIPTLVGVAYYIVWRVERGTGPSAIDG